MVRRPLESLGVIVRKKRGDRKLRETAREIGIGPATLMRVESGRIPDVETFGKLCRWLGKDANEFLGLGNLQGRGSVDQAAVATFAGHFKLDRTPNHETVQALARMMLLASQRQPAEQEPES